MADQHQALYRRYRSKRFGEQVGQEHVMRALRTAVQEDRVGHAYLFSGPRGTGKTSTARILAKVLNCEDPQDGEPCGICPNCVAVDDGRIVDWLLELDAASNSGVQHIRDLIERIPLGTSGNRKVVILDEVHMLTTGAANALLKTLEEPPPHVVFILATTDPQKVLPTIRSRTQHFEFHLLPAEELADHVRRVIADAELTLGEDAVDYVIRQGGGSARDTLSALDQVAAMGGVPAETQPVEAILAALVARDAGAALVAVADATAAGRDPRVLGEVLIGRLRDAFLAVMQAPDRHLPAADQEQAAELGAALGPAGITRALEVLGEALVELAKKPDPRVVLEVALVRLCRPEADRSLEAVLERLERLERAVAAGGAVVAPGSSAPGSVGPEADAPAAGGGSAAAPSPRPAPGPAAAARAELAKVQAATTGAAPGAPGRAREPVRKATAGATAASAPARPAPGSPPSPSPSPSPSASPAAGDAPAADDAPAPAPAPSSGGSALPSVDELATAWPGILAGFTKSLQAVYAEGRFTEVGAGHATFAMSSGHVIAGEPRRSEVEAALARHFGRPVPLRLQAEASAAPDVGRGGGRPAEVSGPPDDEDVGDVHQLEDAPTAVTGVARLTEAFPGAELVEEP